MMGKIGISMNLEKAIGALLVLFSLCTGVVFGQQPLTGAPPFASMSGGAFDQIDLGNLNVHFEIPIIDKPGRGSDLTYSLTYDTSVWGPVSSGSSQYWSPVSSFGWTGITPSATGNITANVVTGSQSCSWHGAEKTTATSTYSNYQYHDLKNTAHPYTSTAFQPNPFCGSFSGFTQTTPDGTGNTLTVQSISSQPILTRLKSALAPPAQNTQTGETVVTDPNGNIHSEINGVFTDTLGTTALTIAGSGTPSSPITLTYPIQSGTSVAVTVKYSSVTVQTNFGCSGISEYGPTAANLVNEIDLPDGTRYTFTYEATPGFAGSTTGRLATVNLPSGGTISYTYSGGANGITCADGTTATLTRQTPDTGASAWTYAHLESPSPWTTTVTDPQANQTLIDFDQIYAIETQIYQGSIATGTLLETTYNCYNGASLPCSSPTISAGAIGTVASYSEWPSGLESETYTQYDSVYGMTDDVKEYGYGSGAPGPLVRETQTSYSGLNRPASIVVKDGSGNTDAQTIYTYDSAPLTSVTGVAQHDDADYGTGLTARGNLTEIDSYVNASTYLKVNNSYDTTGQLLQSSDYNSNLSSLSYTDSLYTDNGSNPPATYSPAKPTNAYITKVTVPIIGVQRTSGYYIWTGDGAMSVDQNGADSYLHFDSSGRLSTSYGPPATGGNRGWTLYQYPGTTGTEIDSYEGIASASPSSSCSSCVHNQQILDNQSRDSLDVLVSDPDGATSMSTTYDVLGREYGATNPFRSTSDSTYGVETTQYDALNRATTLTHADGSMVTIYFGSAVSGSGGAGTQLCASGTYGAGYPILNVDPTGRKRQWWSDSLGRIIETDEQDSSGNLTVGTCYAFDSLNNLLAVSQGSQTRSFSYDWLSRNTSSTTPENGTVTNYFTTAAGGLCSGSLSLICRRTDNRGITTTHTYDALNRITSSSYSDGTTATVTYSYDQTSYDGLTISDGKGRLTGMSDGSGEAAYSFDLAGRIVAEVHTITGISKSMAYTYNLDDSLASIAYPSGRQLDYSYSNAQRALSVVDAGSGASYVSSAIYSPLGTLSSVSYGVSGTFGGIGQSFTYNNRMEMTSQMATSTAGSVLNLTYGFPSSPNNGNRTTSIGNGIDAGRTESFTSDSLRRISTAQTQATSGADCWGQSFGYDRWGNLGTMNSTQCSSPTLSLSTINNQITNLGYTYNASGDMTNDGAYAYTYDGEDRINSANGVTYSYDGRDLRVGKSSGTLYWRGYLSDASSESDLAGNITNDYVFFDGNRIARIDSGSNIYYYFSDRAGSTRAITSSAGAICYSADFTPYGQEINYTNSCPQNYKFATYERDSETGSDYGFYREYSARLGRFLQPDLLGGDTTDPQSLNRYAYAVDQPCDANDPLGLAPCVLKVKLNNSAGLSAADLKALQGQINALFGPSVQVDLSSAGQYQLNLVDIGNNQPLNDLGLSYGVGFAANTYPDHIEQIFAGLPPSTTDRIMGTVSAHELGHSVAGLADTPFSKSSPTDLMSIDTHPNPRNALEQNSLRLDSKQKAKLLMACQKQNGSLSAPVLTNSASLGDDTEEFELLMIPSDLGGYSTNTILPPQPEDDDDESD
jgi:RHS repeat-associated protein